MSIPAHIYQLQGEYIRKTRQFSREEVIVPSGGNMIRIPDSGSSKRIFVSLVHPNQSTEIGVSCVSNEKSSHDFSYEIAARD